MKDEETILYYRTDNELWQKRLQEVIKKAQEYHFVRILSREGAALASLLRKGTVIFQNKEYEKQVRQETTHMEELYPIYLKIVTEDGDLILSDNAMKILIMQIKGKDGGICITVDSLREFH